MVFEFLSLEMFMWIIVFFLFLIGFGIYNILGILERNFKDGQ